MWGEFCDIYSPSKENSNLNIIEAYKRMEVGYKITHEYFSDDEFLYMDKKGIIRDEKGYDFEEGWELRLNDELFYLGWHVKEDV